MNKWDLVKDDPRRQKYLAEGVERATTFIGYAPTLTISALTGKGVEKILPMVRVVYNQYCQEFTTGRLNRLLQEAVLAHSPPLHKGRRVKLYYTTQVTTKPPTFVVFANYPDGLHFSYHRYLMNFFRKGLKIDKAPLRVFFRERERKKYD
jgi:GTP-binding protein